MKHNRTIVCLYQKSVKLYQKTLDLCQNYCNISQFCYNGYCQQNMVAEDRQKVRCIMNDMKKLPYADVPKPLTVTLKLSSADILVLEELVGFKIETDDDAEQAIRVVLVNA